MLPNPNDPLSDQIPSTVIASANKEVLQTITKLQFYGMTNFLIVQAMSLYTS